MVLAQIGAVFFFSFFFLFNEVRDAASNSAYYGYPKATPSCGF
jgi:hypothetical protein